MLSSANGLVLVLAPSSFPQDQLSSHPLHLNGYAILFKKNSSFFFFLLLLLVTSLTFWWWSICSGFFLPEVVKIITCTSAAGLSSLHRGIFHPHPPLPIVVMMIWVFQQFLDGNFSTQTLSISLKMSNYPSICKRLSFSLSLSLFCMYLFGSLDAGSCYMHN